MQKRNLEPEAEKTGTEEQVTAGEPSSAPPATNRQEPCPECDGDGCAMCQSELVRVFDEVMDMAPVRRTLGLNHSYQSGCTCLRCRADNAIEKATIRRSGAAQEVSPPSPELQKELKCQQ